MKQMMMFQLSKMYKCCCLVMLSIAITICCAAQNTAPGKPKLVNPEPKATLPYTHSIERGLLDRAGNLWFSGTEGVFRYDGKLFTNYTTIGGLSIVSLQFRVQDMAEDKAGNIWFGAEG